MTSRFFAGMANLRNHEISKIWSPKPRFAIPAKHLDIITSTIGRYVRSWITEGYDTYNTFAGQEEKPIERDEADTSQWMATCIGSEV
ncbi:hypothetical protein E2C01_057040 [Portunus trituberculatus]|uniref:Uncharacterized protein n=1 Tax=Portunus trituberculatus TaxID=210409 RepID=A0A5B7GZB4_PORTR|nr:hypothetical protein [Portunus trituberculatus]